MVRECWVVPISLVNFQKLVFCIVHLKACPVCFALQVILLLQ